MLLSLDGSVFLEELSHRIGDSLIPHRTGARMLTFRILDVRQPRLGLDVCAQELFTQSAKNL